MKRSIVITFTLLHLLAFNNAAPLNFGFFSIEDLIGSMTDSDSTDVIDELIDFLEDIFCNDSDDSSSQMKPTTMKVTSKDKETLQPTNIPQKEETVLQAAISNLQNKPTPPQRVENNNNIKLNNNLQQTNKPQQVQKEEKTTTAPKPELTTKLTIKSDEKAKTTTKPEKTTIKIEAKQTLQVETTSQTSETGTATSKPATKATTSKT